MHLLGYLFLIFLNLIFIANCKKQKICCDDPNEVYTKHGPSCGGDGCHPIIYILPCVPSDQAGCFCKCGFYRNSEGKCVSPSECPNGVSLNYGYSSVCPGRQCTGEYEYYALGNECLDSCPNPLADCPFYEFYGCYCLPGYKRDPDTKKCIPLGQCTPIDPNLVCGDFEEPGCGPCRTCENLRAGTVNLPCLVPCPVPTCQCIPGYFRNSAGSCVTYEECQITLPICPAGQTNLGCGNCESCFDGIKFAKNESVICSDLCKGPQYCKCDVANNFWRNDAGDCVPLDECTGYITEYPPDYETTTDYQEYTTDYEGTTDVLPPQVPITCCDDKNETHAGCGNCQSCNYAVAAYNNQPLGCPKICLPMDQCRCKPGYFRDSQGNCVLPNVCLSEVGIISPPTCTGKYETSEGCGDCQGCAYAVAAYLGEFLGCPAICAPLSECRCKSGYFKDSQGHCVTSDMCLEEAGIAPSCRGPHEIMGPCLDAPLDCPVCSYVLGLFVSEPVACTDFCEEGKCHCEENFYRNSAGTCVDIVDCIRESNLLSTSPATPCLGPHEVTTPCASFTCPTCDALKIFYLNDSIYSCDDYCAEGICHCETSYFRNSVGICVLPSECTTTPLITFL